MKDFWKMLLAVICGLFLFGFIAFFILFSSINAAVNAGQKAKPVLPRSGILAVDMSTIRLVEQPKAIPQFGMKGTVITDVPLLKAQQALRIAADDPAVKMIFLKTDGNLSSTASIEEFRKALATFRKVSGKPVAAWIEAPTTGGYWLASVADKVYMTEYQGGSSMFNGVSVQSIFLKDLLDKFGVNIQLIRHGKFKSAGEMYTRSESSAENKLQTQEMVNSMWASIRADIAASRGITEEALDGAIDNLELCLPEDFLRAHLVDELMSRDELKAKLATLSVEPSYSSVQFIPFPDYAEAKVLPDLKAKTKIAVLYADGNIVDAPDPMNVSGNTFAAVIDRVRADSSIKAVVLRVNSPGGSVLASEKIKEELDLLGQEKLLVASYGDYAASGGYWISNSCAKIFTDATTLTGSIGVFGMVPDLSKTAKKVLGVNVQATSSNRHGDMYSLMRPFDDAEYAYMLRSIETIYDKFTSTVAEGRGMAKEKVDEIGQGRVWTGADALEINLTDEIGTLSDALSYAASAIDCSLESVQIAEFPEPLSPWEQFVQMLDGTTPEEVQFVRSFARPQVIARMPYQITVL